MSNTEKITCDFAGCDKEYAYRVKRFNLCYYHCMEFTETLDALGKALWAVRTNVVKFVSDGDGSWVAVKTHAWEQAKKALEETA